MKLELKLLRNAIELDGTVLAAKEGLLGLACPGELQPVMVTLAEDAFVLEAQSGFPAEAAFAVGERVRFLAVTEEGLPGYRAFAVMKGVNDDPLQGHFLRVAAVTEGENGTVELLCGARDLLLSVSEQTELLPWRTRQRLMPCDLTKNSFLVAWYDAVMLSLPARAAAQKIVLLQREEPQA